MLRWPKRANAAIRKLFEPLQDVDVYVEDINDEAFYRCLLNSATTGSVKIARIFALGGRKPVVDAAESYDHRTRPALFIVDGDLPWVRGEHAPTVVGLHCHDAYCIENLLLCEKALSTLLSQEIVVTEDEARRRLGYQDWNQSIVAPLVELFAAFATVNHFDPTVATVSQGVAVMCVQNHSSVTELDPVKVRRARDRSIALAEVAIDAPTVSAHYAGLLSRLTTMPNPLRAISGKDFLLPLIDFHLQSLGCRIRRKSLRVRLASTGDMERFSQLANSLRLAARGYS